MKIIGLKAIKCESFKEITKIDDIKSSNGLVWFEKMLDKNFMLSNHCEENLVPFAVLLRNQNISDLLIYSAKGAKYIILTSGKHLGDIDISELRSFQNVANDYLLDTKILYVINSIKDIEIIAKASFDGVIFVDYLMKNELI